MPNETLLDPELRQRQRKRRRLLKIGLALALVVVLILVLGRPTRRAVKAWQARRQADKAFTLIAAEEWNEASKRARNAYQLSASEPQAIRAVARLLSRTRQPDGLGFWKALREKQPLTREDLRDEAAIALAVGENEIAGRAVEALSGKIEGGPGPADWLLAAQLAAQNRAPEKVSDYLAKVVADAKATERQVFQASLFQLAANSARETQAAAWTRVTKIARGQSAVALDALTVLAQHALSSPNEIVSDPAIMPDTEVIQALQAHPLSRAAQKLLAIDLQIHLDQDQRETLIAQAAQTWKTADNESLAILARWLNGKGEFQRELDTIPLAKALQTRDLFLQRLDALGALGNWAEIKRLLQNETFPLDPVIEYMYLARCNQQLGEITAGENNWRRALEAAAGDPQKLLTLADYAEKNGAIATAGTAYHTIARENPGVRAAQQGRLRLAQQKRDTRLIHAILAEMLKQWPNDTAVQNDEAYTRLLLAGGGKTETLNGGTTAVSSQSPPITNQ
ncbi:MAG: hypothetical protein M3429_06865 [Verrucomicrobiota bacterium]|nr:hypothetical protein [Verrucomicrobiota bacterium]